MRILLLCCLAAALAALDIGEKAPPLTGVTWVKGEATQPGTGTVTVVEFWATWCGPCRTSIPHLSKLQAQHGDRLVVIGLSDETRAKVEPFVQQQGDKMAYRVGLIDEAAREAWMAGVDGIPHAFIVGTDGTVLWAGHPMQMDATLAAVVAGTFDPAKAQKTADLRKRIEASIQGRSPDLDKALALNAELLALEPYDAQQVGLRLAIAGHLERPELVRETLAAVPMDGTDSGFYNTLAWDQLTDTPLGLRDLDRAVAFARRAHDLAPEDANITDTWARALHEIGLIDEAIVAQERAIAQAKAGGGDGAGAQATLDYYRTVKRLRTAGVPTAAASAAKPAAGPVAPATIP